MIPKILKPKRLKKEVRVLSPDLKDLIRDEIYGMCRRITAEGTESLIDLRDVKKVAAKIAKRAIRGH